MSKRALLEVIALDARDAVAAAEGGADRLELVTDMAADGLTPSLATFREVRAAVPLPVRVMLRASDGFSAGTPADLLALTDTARALRDAGADEFVFGFLDETGGPDLRALDALLAVLHDTAAPAPARWTFHRAIDRAASRESLRKHLVDLPGLDTYLTAGSPDGVTDGLPTLLTEAARTRSAEPGYEPVLMVGGGLHLSHVPRLLGAGITAFHIGGAARPQGWAGPVAASAVGEWRGELGE
ncbi:MULTISPECIES: copper homeostasis protein CutC [Streptomyces]|uniref:Copper homeostasis protein cutC homolog n=1 Tax=Streptomyces griseus TaxID=1911 RepID=A0A380MND9_STRGR|nr:MULTISPECIES: copper homeostasis protein CutC [Streptomyces]MDQ0294034.1 copper homeostasis protein [Streptomyces sp. DSM 41037]SUO93556.1 Homeostasis protein [Streptomyces griseus]